MTNKPRGSYLEHTDKFLKAKRAVLLWCFTLITLELIQTDEALTPSLIGAQLKVYPRLLGIGLLVLIAYHFAGFLVERRLVIHRHNDLTDTSTGEVAQARLDQQQQAIVALTQSAVSSASSLETSLAALMPQVEYHEANVEKFTNALVEWLKAADERMRIFQNQDPSRPASYDYKRIEPSQVYDPSHPKRPDRKDYVQPYLSMHTTDIITKSKSAVEAKDILVKKLENTFQRINTISRSIDTTEKKVFYFYDNLLTFLAVGLACILFAANCVMSRPISESMPNWLVNPRAPTVARSVQPAKIPKTPESVSNIN